MTRNRRKVWDLNYVTVIMSETTKYYRAETGRDCSGVLLRPSQLTRVTIPWHVAR
jgi:hypothetical protein